MSTPNDSWLVSEIKEFLDQKEIDYKPTDKKAELLKKIGWSNV